jgi:putative endonuclease
MFYVYCLQSEKEKQELYFGFTRDLKNRLKEHNFGNNISTKRYLPWKLIYYEACLNQQDATHREKYLKTYYGKMFIKNRLKSYLTG